MEVGSHTGAAHEPGERETGVQPPWSIQTWLAPGASPCVHHCAFQVWLWKETSEPPGYWLPLAQSAAVQVPGCGGGDGLPVGPPGPNTMSEQV